MNKNLITGLGIGAFAALVLIFSSLFIVNMTQQAIVIQFGEPRRVVNKPGLHFKIPFIQNVVFIDKRLLNLELPEEEVTASDQKRLVVDAFARYRVIDPLKFYQAVRGDLNTARLRLQPALSAALRNTLGENSLEALVRDNRSGLMLDIRGSFDAATNELGIQIVDVRIRRADLPEANSQAIFQRMQTERQREAAEIRAQGQEEAQRIRSRADRDVTVLLAEAERDGQMARGEGDAKRNKIYADSFGKDPEFFAFYRSMQAYQTGLRPDETTMVISPTSEFFRYFGDHSGGRR